jgi:hypothetical protein
MSFKRSATVIWLRDSCTARVVLLKTVPSEDLIPQLTVHDLWTG